MAATLVAAKALRIQKKLQILQKGEIVEADWTGPIRLRLKTVE